MSEQTVYYELTKPEESDLIDIEVLNDNFDTIDSTLHTLADGESAASLLNKIKTVDGVSSGLDADLFQGVTVIPIANGGTGAATAEAARTALGITAAYIQQLFAGGTISVIKSIQRGTCTPSASTGDILINTVNVNKTIVNLTGWEACGETSAVYLYLTDSTHLSWYTHAVNTTSLPKFTWEVVEFY